MTRSIVGGIFFGLLLLVFCAQFDEWVHERIAATNKSAAHTQLGGLLSYNTHSLNFFFPRMVVTDVEMKSIGSDDWSWKCKRFSISFSWISLLLYGAMYCDIVVEGFEGESSIKDGVIKIQNHLNALFMGAVSTIPLQAQSLIFKNASWCLRDSDNDISFRFFYNSSSQCTEEKTMTVLSLYDGVFSYNKRSPIENFSADISIKSWSDHDKWLYSVQASGLCSCVQQKGDPVICYINASGESGRLRACVYSADHSFAIDPIIVTDTECRVTGTIPLSYALLFFGLLPEVYLVNGTLSCYARFNKHDNILLNGYCTLENIALNSYLLADVVKVVVNKRTGTEWVGKVGFSRKHQECKGDFSWDKETSYGTFLLENVTNLADSALSRWYIPSGKGKAKIMSKGCDLIGMCCFDVANSLYLTRHAIQTGFSFVNNNSVIKGLCDDAVFCGEFDHSEGTVLKKCTYKKKRDKELVSLTQCAHDHCGIVGTCSMKWIRECIKNIFSYDIQGEGVFNVHGYSEGDNVVGDIALSDATIRLPETYNFIDSFNTRIVFDRTHNSFLCKDTALSLYGGMVLCPQAVVSYNQEDNNFFLHAPIIINHCLLNSTKDLFAAVSGSLLLSKQYTEPLFLKGSLILDKAQLKENIFSADIQKQLFAYLGSSLPSAENNVLWYDIKLETKAPIKVDTPFLQADVDVDLRVKKQDEASPAIEGTLNFLSGNLYFPYKPLIISRGILRFNDNYSFDPIIELTARNKIKKYDVSLQVSGSLLQHDIILDSSPPLSEEQITTLLLVGSEDDALNSMVPALIMQNIKSFIFTNHQSAFFEKYFAPLLRQFNINVMPRFIDQTGRGGLRGMVEINFDDRWRATIQKNFTLTEDTRFEIEFSLSDDITLRGIRDERRDLGGELEMRWKF